MEKYFSKKPVMEMNEEEWEFDGYSYDLSYKYLQQVISDSRAAQFENKHYILIFSPCAKSSDKYQLTWISKKDGLPSSDITSDSLKEIALRLSEELTNSYQYQNYKVVN